ncbi:Uncharacterized protein HZ326_22054 [Fusarium oxysporum f. sp. albedinis]|nr:Uncharacterized protein HZ326_22054 [Fusarium oxysporum f. sp. albedinis]
MDRGFSAGGSGSSVSRSTSHYNVNVQALQHSIKFIINDPRQMCCSDPPSHICVEAASAAFSDMANYNLLQYAPLPLHNSRHVALHRQR